MSVISGQGAPPPRINRLQLGSGQAQSSPRLRSPRRHGSQASIGSAASLGGAPGMMATGSAPQLSPRFLERACASARGMSPRNSLLSPSGSMRSLGSRSASQNRFILPEEEDRLILKGEQERNLRDARERREQMREAEKLQAEQEHALMLQRKAVQRELHKQEADGRRFEHRRERLEKRELSRTNLWDKFPKVSDLAMAGVPPLSPRGALSPRGPRSPRVGRPPLPPQIGDPPLSARGPRALSPSASLTPLTSPRNPGAWDLNLDEFTRDEVYEMEQQRLKAKGEKELRTSQIREAKERERESLEVGRETIRLQRAAEIVASRAARDQLHRQELAKRARAREQQGQQAAARGTERAHRKREEHAKSIQTYQERERKVYIQQYQEEDAHLRKMHESGQKELAMQEARDRKLQEQELRKRQQLFEQTAKEERAQLARDAREQAQEELRRRRILEVEERRNKVLAVKDATDLRKRQVEEEKCYIYTPAPRASLQVRAAAAHAMSENTSHAGTHSIISSKLQAMMGSASSLGVQSTAQPCF